MKQQTKLFEAEVTPDLYLILRSICCVWQRCGGASRLALRERMINALYRPHADAPGALEGGENGA